MSWYENLPYHYKILIEDLLKIQTETGLEKSIEPQQNYIRAKFISDRIDELLPSKNFFFFKIFKGESKETQRRNTIEKRELDRLIRAHMGYDRYYLK